MSTIRFTRSGASLRALADTSGPAARYVEQLGVDGLVQLSNAVRYEGRDIEFRMMSDDSTVRVLVTDDGPGLRDEDHSLIFEAYYRANDTASIPGSVGTGLTISRDLARLRQGDLTYRYENVQSISEAV